MLPSTIDDLLELVDGRVGDGARLRSAAETLPCQPPCFLLVADADGSVILADDCESGIGREFAHGLARDLLEHLRGSESAAFDVETPLGPRLASAMRLPESAEGGILACLVDLPTVSGEAAPQAGAAGLAAWASARSLARHMAREAELRARVEQLTAGQDAIRASYARSLTDVVDAHEQRLREHEAAQHELQRLHACNKLVLDSAGEGIIGLDKLGQITFVNPAAERILGWTADQMVAASFHAIACHTRANQQPYPWSECPISKTLREGTTERVQNDEVFWRKDGTSFPVEYVATPMQEGREIVGAVVTFQDITQRKLLESHLVQAQKLESIGQLAAGIAHEINTPTQFIGDNLRFLKDSFADLRPLLAANTRLLAAAEECRGREDALAEVVAAARGADLEYLAEEIPKAISQSLEGVERVAHIARSMKEFSHPGGDERQHVDLNRALESTLTICRNEWKYVAEAVTDFDPALPLVHCFPSACNQVFLNLIINAAHAIADKQKDGPKEKGTITVSTRADAEWVEIRVADTGTGIAEEHRTRVFDPFFTTKEVGRGTGQGLSIARSVIVSGHSGTLSFETEVGRGTTFIVRLPRSPRSSSGG